MTLHVRCSLLALAACALLALSAPAAQAEFGIEKFVAVNCSAGHEACAQAEPEPGFSEPKEPTEGEAKVEGFTQAGGHVPAGISDFKVKTAGALPKQVPEGVVTHVRTDVAPGLATSPAAVEQCSFKEFGEKEELPKTGFYPAPKCEEETEIGENNVTVYAGAAGDVPISGIVYNLVPPKGLASDFGVALKLPIPLTKGALEKAFAEHPLELPEPEKKATEKALEEKQYYAHTFIEGNVEWGKQEQGTNQGDYHDYYEVNVSPTLPLIRSRLLLFGTRGLGDFITNATSCPGHNTTTVKLTNSEGTTKKKEYTTPIGLSGCEKVPFEPSFSLTPAPSTHDEPNGLTAELALVRHPKSAEIDASELNAAVVQMPEGMTLNPAAAAGMKACTPAQARIHSSVAGVACPAASQVGTVSLEVPTLPAGSLKGKLYLGGPESGPITGPPYVVYLDAESSRYGVSVRLKGEVFPNEATGQLTIVFAENPEQPFTSVTVRMTEGMLAPIANPLVCGTATTLTTLTPFSGQAAKTPSSGFLVDSNGEGGACPVPLPFSLSQSTQDQNPNAGGHTSDMFNLARADGQQYISQVSTTLPAGLVGAIPIVTPCGEPQAREGTCGVSSRIGKATVQAGAGGIPFAFSGPVYLTGPYNGAPYGLSIAVPAIAGPFNLGVVVTRATINVNPTTARVTVTSVLPRIVKGVPIRVKNISVEVNKQEFLFNPTNCGALATESTVSGFTLVQGGITATQNLSSPFSVGECGKLAFKPSFAASTNGRPSRANGASLEVKISQAAGQANIRSVTTALPKALPSRLTTLQKACLEATFAANPLSCPAGSNVGTATAVTPVLPNPVTGPAYLVSHGGAAFPDLDLVLEANGVRVILVGNTDIKRGITTTTFAASPDVPVSSFVLKLPTGPHSALAANGNLCTQKLLMPTTMVAQNGLQLKQNTVISSTGCPVRIIRRRVSGNTAIVTVQTYEAGRLSGGGSGLNGVVRRLSRGGTTTLRLSLRHRHRPFRTRVRVGFVPSNKGPRSTASTAVTFR